jgi:hypothetical protein
MKAMANNIPTGILIIAVLCLLDGGYAFTLEPADNAIGKTVAKQETPGKPDTILLPNIEYKSEGLRDPFEGVFKTEGQAQGPVMQAPLQVSPPPLTVQGIIWGGKMPQAIVNEKVAKVGDTVADAKITAINKDGIEVTYKNYTFKIMSPAAAQLESLKTKPEGGKNEK